MSDDDEPRHIPGQMDIDECIEIAESGSDGKECLVPARGGRTRRTMSVAEVVRHKLRKDYEEHGR